MGKLWKKLKRTIAFWIVFIFAVLLLLALLKKPSSPEEAINSVPTQRTQKPLNLVPSPLPGQKTEATGQIIVKFRPGISDAQITADLRKYNASIKGHIPGISSVVISVVPGQEDAVRQQLRTDPLVKYSEPDYIQHVLMVPNDPLFNNQWGLANTGQTVQGNKGIINDDIHVEPAWNVSQGAGVKVAIIDTGIDLNHPDLASKVVAQKIIVTSSINDMFGHGTHVAGIIAANTNNGQGIAGVCPQCQLIIIKAMDDNGLGLTSDLATAVIWAADNGAKVINMSEGGGQFSQAQADAVNYAWSKGAVVVGAAGNTNTNQPFYPAANQNVVSVAATDNSDKKAFFSNYGTWVNVAAPGESIFSTLPTHPFAMQSKETLQLNYDFLSGTSMAAPIVSGAIALLWASPFGTSNTSVVQRLLVTVDKIPGTGQFWQDGRINLAKALGVTATPTPTPTKPVATATPTTPPARPTATPTPTIFNGVPSQVCLGHCPTLPPTNAPIPSGSLSLVPSLQSNPSTSPIPQASTSPSGSANPCSSASTVSVTSDNQVSVTAKHRRKHKKRNRKGLLRQLIDLIKKILEIIGKLLKLNPNPGGGGNPGPNPSPSPCPSVPAQPSPSMQPTSAVPSAAITPSQAVSPSAALSMTPMPSSAPSPNPSLTPAGTITPTIFASSGTPVPSFVVSVTPQVSSSLPSQSLSQAPSPALSSTPTPTKTPSGGLVGSIIKLITDIINLILKLLSSLFK